MEQKSNLFSQSIPILDWYEVSGDSGSNKLRHAYAELNQLILQGRNILFVGDSPQHSLDAMKRTLLFSGYDFGFVCTTRSKFQEFSRIVVVEPFKFQQTYPSWVHALAQIEDRGHDKLASAAAPNRGGFISQMFLRHPEGGEDSFQLYAQKCTKLNISVDIFDIVVLVEQDKDIRTLRILKS